jgi:hypothetical protein
LQQTAGNQAVAALVARAPAPVATPTAAAYKPPADLDTLTLGGLNDYAKQQADWARDPALPAAQRDSLINLLEFARSGDKAPLAPCDGMTVHDLLATGLTPDVREKLRTYGRGVRSEDTAAAPKTSAVADAVRDGEALGKLEAGIPKPQLHHVMGEKDEGKAKFPALVAAKEADLFVDYAKKGRPFLEADNGADVQSYLDMVAKDSQHPQSFVGRLPHVHNYHRFLAPMLDTLIANEGDTTRAKPLLLILHSGSDHNGAFHRDPELMKVVQHPRNLTIMVEGAASLDVMGAEAKAIAKRQGKGKRIEQIMIAGHGGPRGMELAGTFDSKSGTFHGDELDLDKNRKRAERFLRGLVASMVKGPGSHIVLNACLTAADEVTSTLPKDPAKAKRAILDSLKNKPSLAGRIGQLAPGIGVEGNVSSVPAGTYMEVDAMGNPTGILHQGVPTDPFATSTNRGDYIEHGVEPEGCVRAVVALWAVDRAECLARVAARRARPVGGWQDLVIHTVYDLLDAEPDNIGLINRIANSAARGLSEYENEAEQVPGYIGGLNNDFSKAEETKILTPLYPHTTPGGQMAMDVVWMLKEPTRRASFLAKIDTFATTNDAEPHLSEEWLAPSMAPLLPVASAGAPTSAQMKLALWGVTGGRNNANAKKFIKAGAAASNHVAVPAGTTVAGLTGGTASEDDVLRAVGLLGPAAVGGPAAPAANLDLDGDGVNDTYVESITRHSVVTAWRLSVRARPSGSSARLESLAAGTSVYAFGRSGPWLAIERPAGGIGFVHQAWVRTAAVA